MAAGLRVILFGGLLASGILSQQRTLDVKPAEVPETAEVAAELIVAHDCKVQGYGDTLIPGHAIVDTGSGPRYARSGIAFKIAFENHPGTVYAFCV